MRDDRMPGHDEITALHRTVVVVVGAQRRAADISAVVVKLVRRVLGRRIPTTDHAPVAPRDGIDIDHRDRVRVQQRGSASSSSESCTSVCVRAIAPICAIWHQPMRHVSSRSPAPQAPNSGLAPSPFALVSMRACSPVETGDSVGS